ncbi:hypothetical protein AYO22_00772 [Fonsecaea multimorphosa]|nr:hypothetical protein AYO22_00772 [Fonsecaea multimorphosa]
MRSETLLRDDPAEATSTANSPAQSEASAILSLIDGAAAEVEADEEAGAEDVDGDAVWVGVVEGCVEDGEPPTPSIVSNVGSSAYVAETPDELLHADDGVPVPATKFTCMH